MPAGSKRPSGIFSFGPFRLVNSRRYLERDGKPAQVGGRALDTLIMLVENAGQVVSHREFLREIWGTDDADDRSLRVQIAMLRKLLDDPSAEASYIKSVAGRGYCFTASVTISEEETDAPAAETAGAPVSLPPKLTRMVGRDAIVETLAAEFAAHRFMTLAGPGGIGKTTVAVAAGHAMLGALNGAVYLIDLSALQDGRLIGNALAAMLGLPVPGGDLLPSIIARLRERPALLIFDNCEHLVAAAAALLEFLFSQVPQLRILATSREPLQVQDEQVHWLEPLGLPARGDPLTLETAMAYPAIQLFLERVSANAGETQLAEDTVPAIAEICRRLDGIALAIELAAGRVAAYGVNEIMAQLDGRFRLLGRGRRTAPPRHATLDATLDWSYNLLDEAEREIFCRLSVFAASFSFEAARAVAGGDGLDDPEILEGFASLVAKCLVSVPRERVAGRYRLLEMTRQYAAAKLAKTGEPDAVAGRHARYFAGLLERETGGRVNLLSDEEIELYAAELPNIRAALDWCFGPSGDAKTGIALTMSAAPLLQRLLLRRECQQWCERAIAALDASSLGTIQEMILQLLLGRAGELLNHEAHGHIGTLTRALELAEQLGDDRVQLECCDQLLYEFMALGEFHTALRIAQKTGAIAERLGDPIRQAVADSRLGVVLHVLGDQPAARRHCEAALQRMVISPGAETGHFERIILNETQSVLARVLWLLGFADQARALVTAAAEGALASDDPEMLVRSFSWIINVLIWTGDWAVAEAIIERFTAGHEKYAIPLLTLAVGFRTEMQVLKGDVETSIPALRERIAARGDSAVSTYFLTSQLLMLALALAGSGDFPGGLEAIESALGEESAFGMVSHRTAQLLRVKGDILAGLPGAEPGAAQACLNQAMALAQRQGALAWELQAATSLARLYGGQGRTAEARALLGSVYGRFTEGFNTLDLRIAQEVLAGLEGG